MRKKMLVMTAMVASVIGIAGATARFTKVAGAGMGRASSEVVDTGVQDRFACPPPCLRSK